MKAKMIKSALPLVLSALALAGCGKEEPKHVHNYLEHAAVASTCKEYGHDLYYSCDCGKIFDANKAETTIEAVTYKTKAAHTYGAATYKWADDYSTCTGSKICSVCNEETKKVVTATSDITDEPTCTEDGAGTFTATFEANSGFETQTKTTTIPALGHSTIVVAGKAATCTEVGWEDYYECARCHAYFEDSEATQAIVDIEAWKIGEGKVDALGHNATKVDGQAPTCETAGWEDYYECTRCHSYFEDAEAETAIADLETWKTGEGKISPLGHTVVKVDGQAASCTEDGWNDYYQCSTCEEYFADLAATEPISDIEAWKTGAGKIAALGHDWEDKESGTAYKYEAHNTWKECTRCHEKEDEESHAPWAHADLTKASEILMGSGPTVKNKDYTPTFTKSATEVTYTGYYNGGIRINTTGAAEGRNILSITLIGSNVSWGVNQYIRAYTDFSGENQVLPCVQVYNTDGVNKWLEKGGKIFDAVGNPITSLTKNAQFTLEMDLTKYLGEGQSVKCIDLWSGYSDSDVESGYANVPTITVKDVSFKETYCGHCASLSEVVSGPEYAYKYEWGGSRTVCTECGGINDESNVEKAPWVYANAGLDRDLVVKYTAENGTYNKETHTLHTNNGNGSYMPIPVEQFLAKNKSYVSIVVTVTKGSGTSWGPDFFIGANFSQPTEKKISNRLSATNVLGHSNTWENDVYGLQVVNAETGASLYHQTMVGVKAEVTFDITKLPFVEDVFVGTSLADVDIKIESITFKESLCGHGNARISTKENVSTHGGAATSTVTYCNVCEEIDYIKSSTLNPGFSEFDLDATWGCRGGAKYYTKGVHLINEQCVNQMGPLWQIDSGIDELRVQYRIKSIGDETASKIFFYINGTLATPDIAWGNRYTLNVTPSSISADHNPATTTVAHQFVDNAGEAVTTYAVGDVVTAIFDLSAMRASGFGAESILIGTAGQTVVELMHIMAHTAA